MYRHIATLVALCLLLAGPAFGAARDVHPGLVMPDHPLETLFAFHSAEVTASGNCLNQDGLGVPTTAAQLNIRNSAACDTLGVNTYIAMFAAKVSNLVISPVLRGDSSYSCVFTIEVDATATGTTLTSTVDLAINVVESQAQNFIINAGDKIGVMVADGAGCGGGSIDPSFTVLIEGQRL